MAGFLPDKLYEMEMVGRADLIGPDRKSHMA